MDVTIQHLFKYPEYVPRVAQWIHNEWWREKPGHTVKTMANRLLEADNPTKIPLSLLAMANRQPAGTVNLVENDNDALPHLYPWLAALLVLPEYRNRGLGTKLVKALISDAQRLGISELYLGTDIPHFYKRLGANIFRRLNNGLIIMKLNVTGF